MKNVNPEELVGEILTHIDVDGGNREILLTTQSGRQFKIYHEQDCCESVSIVDTDGNWHSLIGKPILLFNMNASSEGEPRPSEYAESWTRTTLTFQVDGATVINRWIGESNGYYSESVDLTEVTAAR